jgi:hypothetical protein
MASRVFLRRVIGAGLLAAALAGCMLASYFTQDLIAEAAILAVFALSLDFLATCGLVSFGHAAFFGLGAYGTVLLAVKLGFSVWLSALCGISVATVAAAAIGLRGEGSARRLVAWLVPSGEPPPLAALRRRLATLLPKAMIPAAFAFLPALPTTASGKLDTDALPTPQEAPGAADPARRPPACLGGHRRPRKAPGPDRAATPARRAVYARAKPMVSENDLLKQGKEVPGAGGAAVCL